MPVPMRRLKSSASSKLLYVLTSPDALLFLRGQVSFMRTAGFDVSIIVGQSYEGDFEGAKVYSVPLVREISLRDDVRSLWSLWRLIRYLQPDITIVGTPKAGLIGGLASRLAGVPCRFYFHHGLRLETVAG